MSPSFIHSFRHLLAAAAGLGALAAIAIACESGGGGLIGDGCQSTADCQNQYTCLPVDDAGACSSSAMTCQQSCSDPGDCMIIATNWTCTPMICAQPSGNSGICTIMPTP
jgi:hypothetical protein